MPAINDLNAGQEISISTDNNNILEAVGQRLCFEIFENAPPIAFLSFDDYANNISALIMKANASWSHTSWSVDEYKAILDVYFDFVCRILSELKSVSVRKLFSQNIDIKNHLMETLTKVSIIFVSFAYLCNKVFPGY